MGPTAFHQPNRSCTRSQAGQFSSTVLGCPFSTISMTSSLSGSNNRLSARHRCRGQQLCNCSVLSLLRPQWRIEQLERRKMTRTELIVQLLKIAIGLVFGAYFVWWSLQVLDRLTPEYDAPTAVVARAS